RCRLTEPFGKTARTLEEIRVAHSARRVRLKERLCVSHVKNVEHAPPSADEVPYLPVDLSQYVQQSVRVEFLGVGAIDRIAQLPMPLCDIGVLPSLFNVSEERRPCGILPCLQGVANRARTAPPCRPAA